MKKYINKHEIATGNLILFCGLPCSLKTYLSYRLSGRIGYGYIPTNSVGKIIERLTESNIGEIKIKRYQILAKVVKSAISLGANIIVDGSFPTSKARETLLNTDFHSYRNRHNRYLIIPPAVWHTIVFGKYYSF